MSEIGEQTRDADPADAWCQPAGLIGGLGCGLDLGAHAPDPASTARRGAQCSRRWVPHVDVVRRGPADDRTFHDRVFATGRAKGLTKHRFVERSCEIVSV